MNVPAYLIDAMTRQNAAEQIQKLYGISRSRETMQRQSDNLARYRAQLDELERRGLAYPRACTPREIGDSQRRMGDAAQRHGELPYPGTCRGGLAAGRVARTDDGRFRLAPGG
jgi:glutamyl/glutaminyl-tRNA synthetase